jgi:hypothetical protein
MHAPEDRSLSNRISQFGWLEAGLLVAVVSLVFQLYPPAWWGLVWVVDVRNWDQRAWFYVTIVGLIVLIMVRFGPDLWLEMQQRRERAAKQKAETERVKQARERRKSIEEAKAARRRSGL